MNFRPPSRSSLLTTVAGPLVALALTVPASAQYVVGGTTSPSVFVDQGVLDQLGRTPNLADVLGGGRLNTPARLSRTAPGELQFPIIGNPRDSQPGQIKLRPPKKKTATSRRTRKQTAARRAPAPRLPARAAELQRPPAPPTMAAPMPLQAAPPKMAAIPMIEPTPSAPAARMQPPAPPAIPDAPRPPTSAAITSPLPPAAPDIPAAPTAALSVPPPAPELPPSTKASTPETTIAALPRTTAMTTTGKLGVGSSVRVGFTPGSTKLDSPAEENLKKIAGALKDDQALRIQLLAYAGATSDSASQARRLSLSRALAARSSLISQGVKSARIDVRALGNKSEGGPPDRIDIIVTKR